MIGNMADSPPDVEKMEQWVAGATVAGETGDSN